MRNLALSVLLVSLGLTVCDRPCSAQTDAELAQGMGQVADGDLENGLATLERAARRLCADPSRAKDLAQAYLYMGVASALLKQEDAARAYFREALKKDAALLVGGDRFPAKVVRLFDETRAQVGSFQQAADHAAEGASAEETADRLACELLAKAESAAVVEEYLRQLPDGSCAALARVKLAELKATTAPPAQPAAHFSVFGTVKNPGLYPLTPGLTMEQAIAIAGGPTEAASRSLRVRRVVDGKSKELSVKPDELVRPNDTIVVRARFF
jgi:hypothetical protein